LQNDIISYDLEKFIQLLETGEEFLIERLFHYTTLTNYVKYTSTLKEAWRVSIQGLTAPFISSQGDNR